MRVDVSAPDAQSPYVIRLPDVISPLERSDATRDLTIDAAMGAGAFNVLDVIRRVYGWAMAELPRGSTLPPQHARWELDDPEDNARDANDDPFTHYDPATGEVIIGSSPRQQDDFDASIIGHELMHFVIESLGYGGPRLQVEPAGRTVRRRRHGPVADGPGQPGVHLAGGFLAARGPGDPVCRARPPAGSEPAAAGVSGRRARGAGAARHARRHRQRRRERMAGGDDPPPDRGAPGRDLVDVLDGFREHYGPAIGGLATFLAAERQFPYTAP